MGISYEPDLGKDIDRRLKKTPQMSDGFSEIACNPQPKSPELQNDLALSAGHA